MNRRTWHNGHVHIDVRHHYDASAAVVRKMLGDPEFWKECLPDRTETCRVEAIPDGVCMDLTVRAPVRFRRFVGAGLSARMTVAWRHEEGSGRWVGPVAFKPDKVPGTFAGTCTITPDGMSAAAVSYDGDFTVQIPVVGKVIEQQAMPYLSRTLDAQQAQGELWLAKHPH